MHLSNSLKIAFCCSFGQQFIGFLLFLVPSKVLNITATSLSSSRASITWDDVGGSVFKLYNITLHSAFGESIKFTEINNFINLTSLQSNTNYTLAVFAYNTAGSGNTSTMIFVTRKKHFGLKFICKNS